jgi:hypothetical protein
MPTYQTIDQLVELLDNMSKVKLEPENNYVYVEIGKYKPFHISIINAVRKRGYEVKRVHRQVYYVYPKGVTPE